MKETNPNEWKCVKCGSNEFRKRNLMLRGIMGSAGWLDGEDVTIYVCNKCGYIEFYQRRD
jgi:predicted nucleic-acid-binding Zn-ribbon protein